MKRRDFLTAAGAAAALTTMSSTLISASETKKERWLFEFRIYTTKDADKKKLLVETLDKALIPSLNAQGINPVGVFLPLGTQTKYEKNVYVLIPHKTIDTVLNMTPKLLADENYRKNAAAIFETNSTDPVYENCESMLLHGFETCPILETPELGPDRVFQARLYRSFNIERNKAKIDMFEKGEELATFREVGLNPIFFGESLIGKNQPNLTYMIGCENREKHDKAWKDFAAHPKWHAMKDLPEYADTATYIDRVILTPSPGSQI